MKIGRMVILKVSFFNEKLSWDIFKKGMCLNQCGNINNCLSINFIQGCSHERYENIQFAIGHFHGAVHRFNRVATGNFNCVTARHIAPFYCK